MNNIHPVWTAQFQQRIFRQTLDAMAYPGKIAALYPKSSAKSELAQQAACLAVLATLVDQEVSLCDFDHLLDDNDWPLLQAQRTSAERADYILVDGQHAPRIDPKLGSLSSPDFAATLIIVIDTVGSGNQQLRFSGPGILSHTDVALKGLHPQWLEQRQQWNSGFPLGVDMILVDSQSLLGLPRTTNVKEISL